ncbi:MAG: hypothetical protein ACPGYT_03235 [Nitrospirales bacterium]
MFKKTMRLFSLVLALTISFWSAPAVEAGGTARDFDVTFKDCTEFVGLEPISFVDAQAVVPAGFSVVINANGSALLVVRVSECQAISVGGRAPTPGAVAQIGINILPPDGQGDINNYTLTYASNIKALVKGLRAIGLPAHLDDSLTFDFTKIEITYGNMHGVVAPKRKPTWYVYGQASDPAPNSSFPFRAIWWHANSNKRVRMDTWLPAIAFGNAEVSFQTPDRSILTQLIEGHTIATFAELSVRGVFEDGEMAVSR